MPSCPTCQVELVAINVADRGHGKALTGFAYTVGEAPKVSSWNTNKVKNQAGSIHGYLCPSCNRVLLYAHPGEKP